MTTIREGENLTAYEVLADVLENKTVVIEAHRSHLDVLQHGVLRLSRDLKVHIGGELKTRRVGSRQLIVVFDPADGEVNAAEETEVARV